MVDEERVQLDPPVTAPLIPVSLAVFENKDKIVIVMEYASRGDLYDYICDKRNLSEREARHFFRQIVSAVHYCHQVSVESRQRALSAQRSAQTGPLFLFRVLAPPELHNELYSVSCSERERGGRGGNEQWVCSELAPGLKASAHNRVETHTCNLE